MNRLFMVLTVLVNSITAIRLFTPETFNVTSALSESLPMRKLMYYPDPYGQPDYTHTFVEQHHKYELDLSDSINYINPYHECNHHICHDKYQIFRGPRECRACRPYEHVCLRIDMYYPPCHPVRENIEYAILHGIITLQEQSTRKLLAQPTPYGGDPDHAYTKDNKLDLSALKNYLASYNKCGATCDNVKDFYHSQVECQACKPTYEQCLRLHMYWPPCHNRLDNLVYAIVHGIFF